MYVKITAGGLKKYPYSLNEFRASKRNVSFPKDIPTEILEANNIFVVKEIAPPNIDTKTHKYTCDVELIEGEWTQVWTTSELPQEVAERNVRTYRDRLLVKSDWTQVPDSPVSSETWATYRQALRDVTEQEGFPYNVTWPTEPT